MAEIGRPGSKVRRATLPTRSARFQSTFGGMISFDVSGESTSIASVILSPG